MRKKLTSIWWNDQKVTNAVSQSNSLAASIRYLGLAVAGASYSSIKRHIKRLNLDTSHFDPYGSRKVKKKYQIKDIFVKNSSVERCIVRKRILEDILIPYECTKCGNNGRWKGETLSLQLEHKNGIRNDHRLENLEFLCPNCHTQTSTWGSKNSSVMAKSLRKFGSRQDYSNAVISDFIASQTDNIKKVKEAGILFGKRGWSKQVAELLNIQPQRVKWWMLRCMPDIYKNINKR